MKYQVQLEILGTLRAPFKACQQGRTACRADFCLCSYRSVVDYLSRKAIDIEEGSRFLYLAAALSR